MTAIAWWHFINTCSIIVLLMALSVSLPVPAFWRGFFQLPQAPLALKKSLIVTLGVIALAWLLAWPAPHITSPLLRVNLVAVSELILTLACIALSIIVIYRIGQKNNVLALFFVLMKRHLPEIGIIIGKISYACFVILLEASEDAMKKQTKLQEENMPYQNPKNSMNYRGDYCDAKKRNWYF